ncbi:MAG TPA: SIMPL domain-containing protein [Sporichthyaceae bacterium]|jgi:hypothetical protein
MKRNVRRVLVPTSAAAVVGVIVTTLIVGNGSGPVRAVDGDASAPNTVSVSGLGRVTGTPDVLRLAMGVQRTGSDVNNALNLANGDIKRITDALHKHGVAEKDIQTSDLSINPHWDKNRINGYDVAESLTAQLRKLSDAGAAISDAAAAGGNATRIDSVSFDIEDNQQLVDQARTAAFADAKAKAEQYAKLAGRSLGRVSQVSESTDTEPRPVPYAAMDAAGAAEKSAVPISAGSQQVSVTTSVVWELN